MKQPEIVVNGIPFGTPQEEEALRYVKENGFTSVQIYVFWRRFEPERRSGFDWAYYDEQVRALQRAGLKFVPFFLMGPKYAAPDWWLQDPGHKSLYCLEHGEENPIESVWNPAFLTEVDRVLDAYAAHYRSWDVIESFQPGICGDYGEAIFPVLGNWPGDYHTHPGYWCGGEDAKASFRAAMREQYGSIEALNKRWTSAFSSFEEVAPFLRHKAPSRTAWFDFINWYSESMNRYTDAWMELCRRHFPDTPVYLCTGGSEEPEHGSVFSAQAKIAARHQSGIRLTNEGNNFFTNLHDTIHMHSACEYYGAFMGLEPAGPMLPQGVVNRMYGSAVFGNRQIFHYYGNLLDAEGNRNGAAEEILRYRDLIREQKAAGPVTLYWPLDEAKMNGTRIPEAVLLALDEIRKLYEVRVVDETMILDGALRDTPALIMLDVHSARTEALQALAAWVKAGGHLLSNCRPLSIELEPVAEFDAVFGILPGSEEARGHAEFAVQPAGWCGRLAAVPSIHASGSWFGLAPEVRPLAIHKGGEVFEGTVTKRCFAAFEHDCGMGKAVYYGGALDLNTPADAIFTPSPAFRYLLEDFCRAFSGAEAMELKAGEQMRSHVGSGLLILTDDGKIRWDS